MIFLSFLPLSRPSDLEADDEDTQDGDSLNHLKLDVSLTELNIQDANGGDGHPDFLDEGSSPATVHLLAEVSVSHRSKTVRKKFKIEIVQELERTRQEMKQLVAQLTEARREISLLKAERDFLREQNLGLRNQNLSSSASANNNKK